MRRQRTSIISGRAILISRKSARPSTTVNLRAHTCLKPMEFCDSVMGPMDQNCWHRLEMVVESQMNCSQDPLPDSQPESKLLAVSLSCKIHTHVDFSVSALGASAVLISSLAGKE